MRAAKLLTAISCACLVLASCRQRSVFDQEVNIGGGGWAEASPLAFKLHIDDTLSPHQILFSVTNNDDYNYANLFLFATVEFPGGKLIRDTVELVLADPRGRWTGDGWFGSYHNDFPYRARIRFPRVGNYTFRVWQAMRCPSGALAGIESFEINVLK